MRVPSKEVYDAGYAISVYDCRANARTFRFRDEELTVTEPMGEGPVFWYFLTEYKGWECVAKWEEVKRAGWKSS